MIEISLLKFCNLQYSAVHTSVIQNGTRTYGIANRDRHTRSLLLLQLLCLKKRFYDCNSMFAHSF